jgi:hypothetical protein
MMKRGLFPAGSAIALAALSTPLLAQMQMQMQMPGMAMPMSSKSAAKATVSKKAEKHKAAGRHAKERALDKKPPAHRHHIAAGNSAIPMHGGAMAMTARPASGSHMQMPMSPEPALAGQVPMPMGPSQTQSGAMIMPMAAQPSPVSVMTMPMAEKPMGAMPMNLGDGMGGGAFGPYPGKREASGTAWQPDSSQPMTGPMLMRGAWMLMAHGTFNLVYDHQSGLRGDDKVFANGMLMAMARHPLGGGMVQFRAMVSPDPSMGPGGYPLLLASGETANGKTPLVDRQHPHDLFMELSASLSRNIGSKGSIFLYAGLPGEPAFGPPAFMHRESIEDSPEAPIAHHWLDSTHVSFGVVTAGLVLDRFKIETSRFNAREPDQHRWNIETGPLDSTSVRLSWNPTSTLAIEGSWARFIHPEQLEPGVNQTRWSASALWANDVAPGWHAAATLAWGRKSSEGHSDDGGAAEASLRHAGWTLFGRGEWVENRELLGTTPGPAYKVGKISLGAVRDVAIADHLSFGVGGLVSLNFVPNALAPLYGSQNPLGMMGFARLKLN